MLRGEVSAAAFRATWCLGLRLGGHVLAGAAKIRIGSSPELETCQGVQGSAGPFQSPSARQSKTSSTCSIHTSLGTCTTYLCNSPTYFGYLPATSDKLIIILARCNFLLVFLVQNEGPDNLCRADLVHFVLSICRELKFENRASAVSTTNREHSFGQIY